MATLTRSYKLNQTYITLVKKRDKRIRFVMPRRCMIVSGTLILAGFGIPLLMVISLIPVSLLLDFLAFGLVATGGVMALIFCGEI
jgi:hypothetical protein